MRILCSHVLLTTGSRLLVAALLCTTWNGLAYAQCTAAPRLVAPSVTCKLGAPCEITVTLESGTAEVASAAAALASPSGLTCDSVCSAGAAAANASCSINATSCKFNVIDLVFPITAFGDGSTAVATATCTSEGSFALTLSDVSLGATNGTPVAGACGTNGTIDCVQCLVDGDCAAGALCDSSGSCVECLNDAQCDDADACTIDSCTAGVCANDATAANGSSCNDGLFCTATDTCQAGACIGSGDPCSGGDTCASICDEALATCNLPASSPCDDGDACTDTDVCDGLGGCAGSVKDCSGIDDVCNTGSCNPASGSCVATPRPDGTSCPDGLFCNGAETCVGGTCTASPPPVTDDGVDCTVDSCDEAADAIVHSGDDARCDDGLFCNGNETCDNVGGCQAGSATVLDDGVACTVDSCDETADVVVHSPSNALCNDGLFCNGIELCNPQQGCEAGTASLDCASLDTECSVALCSEDLHECEIQAVNEGLTCGQPGDGMCTFDAICIDGECIDTPACDPLCERCDEGGCVSLCANPVDNEVDEITIVDALLTLRAAVGTSECPPCICDVNNSGAVTATDTLTMMRSIVQLPAELVCPAPETTGGNTTTTTTTTTVVSQLF